MTLRKQYFDGQSVRSFPQDPEALNRRMAVAEIAQGVQDIRTDDINKLLSSHLWHIRKQHSNLPFTLVRLSRVRGAINYLPFDQVVTTNQKVVEKVPVAYVTASFLVQPLALITNANSA
jgi:hypothetical protein